MASAAYRDQIVLLGAAAQIHCKILCAQAQRVTRAGGPQQNLAAVLDELDRARLHRRQKLRIIFPRRHRLGRGQHRARRNAKA